jgi:release factor glutamine methyltransferase
MERHVLDHEPHLALFVPDDDPLLFYRSIARYAIKALKPDGALCLEINPLYARQLDDMLQETGFRQVTIHQDDYDKDRYIIAWK